MLADAGYLMEDIQREIAARTPLLLDEVASVFEDACVRSLDWDNAIYQAAGLDPAPLRMSPYLMDIAQRNYEATRGELRNFTGTMASAAQRTFIRECDKAYQLVAGGAMGYTQAVRQAVETVAAEGVMVTYPSGHRDTIETATLRAVRTGVGQACGDMTMARMREMHWPIVLVSAHLGARTGDGGEDHTNHFWWQGKFYRLDDETGPEADGAAQPQQEEAEHPKTAAVQSGPATAPKPVPKPIEPEDVTEEYIRTATPGQGEITYDDGYEVGKHSGEIKTAQWLHDTFGGDIRLLKEAKENDKMTPDYIWRGKCWELKGTGTISGADSHLRRAFKQIQENPGGVIINMNKTVNMTSLEKQLFRRFLRGRIEGVDLMLLRDGELHKVLRCKKEESRHIGSLGVQE